MHHAQQRGVDDISRRRDSSRAGLVQDLRDVRLTGCKSFRYLLTDLCQFCILNAILAGVKEC
jgi:hypothetical protein